MRAIAVAALEAAVRHLTSLQWSTIVRATPPWLAMAQGLVAHSVTRAFHSTILVATLHLAARVLGTAVVTIRPALVFTSRLTIPASALALLTVAVAIAFALAVTVAALECAVAQRLSSVVFVVPSVVALAQTIVALAMACT